MSREKTGKGKGPAERAAELRLVAERAIKASLELADMLEAA